MKKKLGIICNSTNPDLVQYFQNAIASIQSVGLQDSVVFFTNMANFKGVPTGVDVRLSSLARSAFFDFKIVLDFFLSIKNLLLMLTRGIHCLHFTTAHVSNLFLAVPAKLLRMRLIFTMHDLVPHPGRKQRFISMYNKLVIELLADEVISFSRKLISESKNPGKYCYMALSGFEQIVNTPKTGNRILLFFGRIESYKGMGNLLNIAKMAQQQLPDWEIVIAGKGAITQKHQFEELNNVTIINRFIEEDELRRLFSQASFVILPYDSATQSGVIIISYAHATPVIAYDVGAISEYISEQTGFLVQHGDDQRIIDKLRIMTDTDLLTYSSGVIKNFMLNYSRNASIRDYANFYKKVLGV